MKIKKFNDFVNESISGTELVGSVGPAYGETGLQNKTISQTNTSLVSVRDGENSSSKNDLTKDLFFEDDYVQLHNDYLKAGGLESNLTGDYEQDLGTIMDFLRSSEL
jgi:hypothetical protein